MFYILKVDDRLMQMFDSFHSTSTVTDVTDRLTVSRLDAQVQHAVVLMPWPSCTSGQTAVLCFGNVWTCLETCKHVSPTLKNTVLAICRSIHVRSLFAEPSHFSM